MSHKQVYDSLSQYYLLIILYLLNITIIEYGVIYLTGINFITFY